MNCIARVALLLVLIVLSGCSGLQSPGGRVVWLVLIPAVLVAAALYLLRRGATGPGGGRGPRHPDYDERE
jgi:hypothetical protein